VECKVHRTPFRNLNESGFLRLVQGALERQFAKKLVAASPVALMCNPCARVRQWPVLAPSIETHGHYRTGSKRGAEKLEGIRAGSQAPPTEVGSSSKKVDDAESALTWKFPAPVSSTKTTSLPAITAVAFSIISLSYWFSILSSDSQ
jgi:hypothetical protein